MYEFQHAEALTAAHAQPYIVKEVEYLRGPFQLKNPDKTLHAHRIMMYDFAPVKERTKLYLYVRPFQKRSTYLLHRKLHSFLKSLIPG